MRWLSESRDGFIKVGMSPEAELRDILKEIESSIVAGSAAETFARHTAPDYVFTSPAGRVSSRSQILDGLRSGSVKFTSYAITELDVRVYGSSAVVIGKAVGAGTNPGGEELRGVHRFTSAWTNEGSEWKLVAWQATEVTS